MPQSPVDGWMESEEREELHESGENDGRQRADES
jgi:hypothetical protein